jgi:hypothetical protein
MVQAARSGKQNIVEASQASGTSKEMEIKLTGRLRALNRTPDATYETFRKGIESPDPQIAANMILGPVRVTNYLLDHQLRTLEQAYPRRWPPRTHDSSPAAAKAQNQLDSFVRSVPPQKTDRRPPTPAWTNGGRYSRYLTL